MKISSAEFVCSNTQVDKCPGGNLPEYAFIGRSNVGKSSLINMLLQRKGLAKTSGKPGKTQLINHFLINDNWHLVDLPGYGYASVSKKQRKTFQSYITDYFLKRKQLVLAFVLVDCRHEPQQLDLDFMKWMGQKQIPFAIVFTKADKLREQALKERLEHYQKVLLEDWESLPTYFITSSTKGYGRDQLLDYIQAINTDLAGLGSDR